MHRQKNGSNIFFLKKWVQIQLFYGDPNLIECLNLVDVQATIGQETLNTKLDPLAPGESFKIAQLLEKRGVDAQVSSFKRKCGWVTTRQQKNPKSQPGIPRFTLQKIPCEMTWETFRHRGTYTRLVDPRVAG